MSATKAKRTAKAGEPATPTAAPVPPGATVEEAKAYEAAIAEEAQRIRGNMHQVTVAKFGQLWPLLTKPIPPGFIEQVGIVKGKPYESTGVSSMHVLIARMDNVLGPLSWSWSTDYAEDGMVCKVTVRVGDFLERSSWGGVDRGSTKGNVYKGSETNAAKRAFAAIGPGREIYMGTPDLDPDTHKGVAEAQEAPDSEATEATPRKLTAEEAGRLLKAIEAAGLQDALEAKLRSFGVAELTDLDTQQAIQVYEWAGGEVRG